MIEVTRDVKNPLLSRREITCRFKGLAGRLKKLEAAEMISKEFKLENKFVIPMNFKGETGKPVVSGTFYVYDDEKLAKNHLKAAVFKRIEKAKGTAAKTAEAETKETQTGAKEPDAKSPKEGKSDKENKEVSK